MQLQATGTQVQVMNSLQAATGVMQSANAELSVTDITHIMKDFKKEQMKQEMNSEMIGEAMDIGDANTEEADGVYNQILGELEMEVNMGAQIGSAGIA